MQLTNLVINRTADNIVKSMTDLDIEKARHGVYADTEENRRLRRVGQEYGKAAQKEEPAGQRGKKVEEKQDKGSKAQEQKSAKKPASKEELFSKNGMLDEKGNMNSKSEHVKRMWDLEKKVDSGKATPEEKQEYATLRNQAANEKERFTHELGKKYGLSKEEPKYKTVDERRAEYKKEKEEREKANAKTPEQKQWEEREKKMDSAMKDSRISSLVNSLGHIDQLYMDTDEDIIELLDMGYQEDSNKVVREVKKKILRNEMYDDEITYAVNKYGEEMVKDLLTYKTPNSIVDFEDFAGVLIASVALRKKEQEKISSIDKTKDVNWDSVDPQDGMKKIFDSVENMLAQAHGGEVVLTDRQEDRIGNTMRKLINRGLTEEQFDNIAKNYESISGVIQPYEDYKYFIPYLLASNSIGDISKR